MKATLLRKIPAYAVFSIAILVVFVVLSFVFRTLLLWLNMGLVAGEPASKVAHAFLLGLQFDLVTYGTLYGLFVILWSFRHVRRFRWVRNVLYFLAVFLMVPLLGLFIADLIYYGNANKHIGYEAYVYLGPELIVILQSALERNLVAVVAGVVALGAVIYAIITRLRGLAPDLATQTLRRDIVEPLIAIAVILILVRGGVQLSPIRPGNAMFSDNQFLNNLALNGVYTTLIDLKSAVVPVSEQMDRGKAIEVVRAAISYPGARFTSDEYPILRRTVPSSPRPYRRHNPNIVLILLENWTGKFISPITDGLVNGREVAPEFNRLAKQGIFFRRFFATGGRTTNGMMSMLAGIPDKPGLTVVRTSHINDRYAGIGSVFASQGYKTLFYTGGDLKFDNKHIVAPHFGYQEVHGLETIEAAGRFKLGAWGYDDEAVFQMMHERLLAQDTNTPFFATILTLTTHYPYRTPEQRFNIFGADTPDHEFLNVYHYADWALGRFMEQARKSTYFNNTIFVMVADHTHHRDLNYYEDRNVPFLIYAPGLIRPEVREDIGSHLDTIPTLAGFLDSEVDFAAMGRDLLDRSPHHAAYFAYGNLFGWIENDAFTFRVSNGKGGRNHRSMPPFGELFLCETDPTHCAPYHEKSRAFLNLSNYLLTSNRIFPDRSRQSAVQ